MGFCYRVELTRRVDEPFYGPDAYRNDTKRKDFPFGKGKEFSTGFSLWIIGWIRSGKIEGMELRQGAALKTR